MNQILSMGEEPKKRENEVVVEKTKKAPVQNEVINRANSTSNKADIGKIIKIFCISIILFGLILIGESVYALVSNSGEKGEDNVQINAERMGKETVITVQTEQYPVKEFTYKWNDGEPVTIDGNGTLKLETIIQIPNGNNILRMTVTDYYGNKKNFHKQYLYDSSDVNKPTIEIAINGTKLNIKAIDDVQMSYITYSWNDEEATRIEAEGDNLQEINTDIEVPDGQSKLSIIAVDKEGNRETRTENVIGDTKPSFSLSKDGLKIILNASDDQGISKISMTIDDETRDSGDEPINQKEVSVTWEVTSGTHTISVSVTNVNGLTSTGTVTADI